MFFWLTSPQSSPHLPTDGPVAEQIVGGRVLVRHNKDDYCDDDDDDDCDDDGDCFSWIQEDPISLKDSLAFLSTQVELILGPENFRMNPVICRFAMKVVAGS